MIVPAMLALLSVIRPTPEIKPMLAYPVLTRGDNSYVVSTDDAGKISDCKSVQAVTSPVSDADCAALIAEGVPAGIVPARSKGNPASWIRNDDLPDKIHHLRGKFTTQFLMIIGVDGRVSRCLTYVSSGNDMIDALACKTMLVRARFSPATYNRNAVPSAVLNKYTLEMR